MKTNATFTLEVEQVEMLNAMSKRTDVKRSALVRRALTMLFNEHAMEVRRSEGGPMWLAPMKPLTVAESAPTELPAPPSVPSADPTPPFHALAAASPAEEHKAPVATPANGAPARPAPFFPPRARNVTLT